MWGGGKLPPQNTQLPPPPPQKKERKKNRGKGEREGEERERCMVGERERIYLCVTLQVISIDSYFMTQLFKSTR